MYIVKFFLILILSFVVGFGFWYLVFWFVSNIKDPFQWHWITKIVYLFFGLISAGGTIDTILKENEKF